MRSRAETMIFAFCCVLVMAIILVMMWGGVQIAVILLANCAP